MAGVNIPLGRRPAPEQLLDEEEAAPITPPPPLDPEERRRQVLRDQSAAKRADTAYAAEAHDLLHGPEGLFARTGFDAVDAASDAHAALGDARARALETLTSPVARALFTDAADERDAELKRRIGVFLVDQERTGATDASLARQAHAEGEFKRAFLAGDTDGAAAAWRTVGSEIAGRGRAGGASDEAVAAEAEETRKALHADAVEELAKTDPVGARALLEQHRETMAPEDAARLEGPIRANATQEEAKAATERMIRVPPERKWVADRIRERAKLKGLDVHGEEDMIAMGMLESTLNPDATPNGKYKRLYQFDDKTFKWLGYNDITDLNQQIDAGVDYYLQHKKNLKRELGHDPEVWELYLAHQQGETGALKLLKADRNANAAAVRGKAQIVQNGGDAKMTVQAFLDMWKHRTNQKLGLEPPDPRKPRTAGARRKAAKGAGRAELAPGDLPDRHGFADSVAALAPADDPQARDVYYHTAAARWDELAAERGDRSRAAWAEAEPLVRAGVPFHRWPEELLAQFSPAARDGVMRAGPAAARPTDWSYYGRLREMAHADPTAFRGEEPAAWLPHLAGPEHDEMVGRWTDAHDAHDAVRGLDEAEGAEPAFAAADGDDAFDDGADYDDSFEDGDEDGTGLVKAALRRRRGSKKPTNPPWDWKFSAARTAYGETGNVYPLGIDPRKGLYDVGNYDPKSVAKLRFARALIAVAASRNPDHREYDASGSRKELDQRQWGVTKDASADGQKLLEQGVAPDGHKFEVPRNLNFFFVRNTSKYPRAGAQHPGAPHTTFYGSVGPFRAAGGGDAGKGEVYIDFYLEDPDARRKPAKPKPVSPGTKRKQTA